MCCAECVNVVHCTKEQRDGDQENAAAEAHSLLKWVHAHPYFISISTPDSSFYCARTHTERAAGENASEWARAEREMKNPPEQWIEKRAHVFFARNIYMSGWIHNFGLKSGNTFQCTTMAGVPPPQPPACLLLEVGVGRVRPRFPTHAHRASVSILLRRRLIDFYIFSGLLYARYTARHAKWIAVYGFC